MGKSDLSEKLNWLWDSPQIDISNISKGGIGSNDLTDRNSYGGDGLVTIDYLDVNETTIYKEYYTYKENNEISLLVFDKFFYFLLFNGKNQLESEENALFNKVHVL